MIVLRIMIAVTVVLSLGAEILLGQLETGYGKRSQYKYEKSVSGTRSLASLFESFSGQVVTRSTLSKKIERYQTIVWVPDSFEQPSDRLIDRVEEWLDKESFRTFIYIGRDYDGVSDYWRQIAQSVTGNEQANARRQWALARSEHLSRRYRKRWQVNDRWFKFEDGMEDEIESIDGPWAEDLLPEYLTLQLGSLRLVPPDPVENIQITTLLEVNGQPYVFQLKRPNYSRVIVVNNGSGLLNFPLSQFGNEEFAQLLADEHFGYSQIVFLESGESEPRITNSDTKPNMWTWIQEPPLNYIVPHFIVLGILACFVFFPIFGRPRRSVTPATTRFSEHTESIGRLIGNSSQVSEARDALAQYQKTIRSD
jgi:hypothetical protein